MDFQNTCL